MDEQTRNADSRIKSYIDTIDALNRKDATSRSQVVRLKQEAEAHQRELSMLRGQLNSRKLELDGEAAKSIRLEKDLIESKTTCQLLRGKMDSLEKRMMVDKAKWEEERQNREKVSQSAEVLQAEIQNLRLQADKDYAELSKLRIENVKLKEKDYPSSTEIQENLSTSMGSNKRGLLDEIERKNSELQCILVELKNKQLKIEKLSSTIEELNVKLRTSEREVGQLRTSMSGIQLMQSEPFNQTSPVPINSSRPSTSGGYYSQQAAGGSLVVQQKEQEIADLKSTIADLRREIDEKTGKMQRLIEILRESESGVSDKEKRLESKIGQKDKELSTLRQEMIELEEENVRIRLELEDKLQLLQLERDTLAENSRGLTSQIDKLHIDINDKNDRLIAAVNDVDRLTSAVEDKDQRIADLESTLENNQLLEDKIKELEDMVEDRDNTIEEYVGKLDDLASKLGSVNQQTEQLKNLEEQVEYLGNQCHKTNTTLRRYQEVSNSMHFNSIKFDTVYRNGISVFVKYARSIYIPLVFNYQISQEIQDVNRESSIECLEAFSNKIRKMQDQVQAFEFVLDLNSLSPRIKKILDSNSMVVVCRVDNVVREKVDLKTNKELVSFVHSGIVCKVQVEDVLCLMSASFDNAIDASEFRMIESGGQNKTFQF